MNKKCYFYEECSKADEACVGNKMQTCVWFLKAVKLSDSIKMSKKDLIGSVLYAESMAERSRRFELKPQFC